MRNVRDFGAVGDGVHSDTQAIQKALDAGGTVLFPPGRYLSGTIFLRSHGGRLDEETCRDLLLPVAGALDYAHSVDVFHLDVKPQNIMVRKTPRNGAKTCLLDFGIASSASSSDDGDVYGTQQYMPPERGEKPSAAMDV